VRVSWDPNAIVLMQSASRYMERTCGLAIPFQIGGIVIYLQVHILPNLLYQVLLGRPFNMLTKSQIQNSSDGGQTLTLTDLNSRAYIMLLTYPKEEGPRIIKKNTELVGNF